MGRVDHLLNQPVSLLTPADVGPPDRYGQPTQVYGFQTVYGHVRQVTTQEQLAQGEVMSETIEVYLPTTVSDLSQYSAVMWGNRRYQIQGMAQMPWNPRTQEYEYISFIASVVKV